MAKNLPANAGGTGSIPGSERSPGVGNGNPLQYSCLRNAMGRGAWQASVCEVTRVGLNLATKQQQSMSLGLKFYIFLRHLSVYSQLSTFKKIM